MIYQSCIEVVVINRKREVSYILQKSGQDSRQIAGRKKDLIKRGYLAVTIIEGNETIQKGLLEIIKNHIP